MRPIRTTVVASILAAMLLIGGAGRARAGLVSQRLFNETGGAVTHDSAGGINGELSGGAAFDPGAGPGKGIYSGAISLNEATDSYVNTEAAHSFTSGSFSIVAWMKTP